MDITSSVVAGGALVAAAVVYVRSRRALTLADERLARAAENRAAGETLLTAVVESSPTAVVMLRGAGTIVFTNSAARDLFFEGRDPANESFLDMLRDAPTPLREALLGDDDVLFNVTIDGEDETFHLSKRTVAWQGDLSIVFVRHLTRELRRQEVAVWKKLLRVISHELNNSLAPISSLAHTARQIAKSPDKLHLLDGVFETIEDRTRHLSEFLASYVDLARLPTPRRAHISIAEVVKRVCAGFPRVKLGELVAGTAFVDEKQIEQVLVNLVKNAVEAAPEPSAIEVDTKRVDGGIEIAVRDRGPGMTADVLRHALLPFYSTKEKGTGLGLALCREIVDAHGGKIRLQNREAGGLEVVCFFPEATRRQTTHARLTISSV